MARWVGVCASAQSDCSDIPSTQSSELSDLSLTPTHVCSARITIIHPQLRDLILPLGRGDVLYPRGNTIDHLSWNPDEEGGDDVTMSRTPVGGHA